MASIKKREDGQWRAAQVHREGTVVQVEGILRRHVYPVLGDRPISSVLPSDVQSLAKRLSTVPRRR